MGKSRLLVALVAVVFVLMVAYAAAGIVNPIGSERTGGISPYLESPYPGTDGQ